ncbi:Transcriptional regulator, contains HTH domain [Halapricum desulfuricans]|uniref:Transcriptional regulator, contains HTH domain n=2 Tax=Halapricum desulfuricans TaxID=2841257 RepID=A0A897NKL6_9EURY|nr:helix-turn-helix domain-containing protein [Halapricum desulfuricans]QSG13307.1 Transcriptional regulator, contains HTH domain [Halapricum desulfuricans]
MSQHETRATADPDEAGIRMTLSFPEPDAARELLLFLGRSMDDESFSIDAVGSTDAGPHVIAVDDITDAQRSTASYAVACGYYDNPRSARLADIAAAFDRSESAISQRLNAVERHLVRSFVDANDGESGAVDRR